MDSDDRLAAVRVDRFLETEPVVWLSTVRPDGAPHLVPTWFAWDGETIDDPLQAGRPKVRNLRGNDPRAMLALGDAEDDFDVGLLEATATIVDATPRRCRAAFLAKYASASASLGLTPAQFAATYARRSACQPTRALGWHGRSPTGLDRRRCPAGRRERRGLADRAVQGRTGLREWLGEPLGTRASQPCSWARGRPALAI